MMPWKLYADAAAYIFTWLIGYSSLMGAIGGILIADYWVLRRSSSSPADLFKLDGRYAYTSGVNSSAVAALVSGGPAGCPRLHPRGHDAGRPGRRSHAPRLALHLRLVRHLRAGFALYLALMKRAAGRFA